MRSAFLGMLRTMDIPNPKAKSRKKSAAKGAKPPAVASVPMEVEEPAGGFAPLDAHLVGLADDPDPSLPARFRNPHTSTLPGPVDPMAPEQAVYTTAVIDGSISPTPDADESYTVRGGMLVFTTDAGRSSSHTHTSGGTMKKRSKRDNHIRVFANCKGLSTEFWTKNNVTFVGVAVDNVIDGKGARANPSSLGTISVMVSGAVTIHCDRGCAKQLKFGDVVMYCSDSCTDTFTQLPKNFSPVMVSGGIDAVYAQNHSFGRVLDTDPDQGTIRVLLDSGRRAHINADPVTPAVASIKSGQGNISGPVDPPPPQQPVFIKCHADLPAAIGDRNATGKNPVEYVTTPPHVLVFTANDEKATASTVGNKSHGCRAVFSNFDLPADAYDPARVKIVGVSVDGNPTGGMMSVAVAGSVSVCIEPHELAKMQAGDLLRWEPKATEDRFSCHVRGYKPCKIVRVTDENDEPNQIFARLIQKPSNERIGEGRVLLLPPASSDLRTMINSVVSSLKKFSNDQKAYANTHNNATFEAARRITTDLVSVPVEGYARSQQSINSLYQTVGDKIHDLWPDYTTLAVDIHLKVHDLNTRLAKLTPTRREYVMNLTMQNGNTVKKTIETLNTALNADINHVIGIRSRWIENVFSILKTDLVDPALAKLNVERENFFRAIRTLTETQSSLRSKFEIYNSHVRDTNYMTREVEYLFNRFGLDFTFAVQPELEARHAAIARARAITHHLNENGNGALLLPVQSEINLLSSIANNVPSVQLPEQVANLIASNYRDQNVTDQNVTGNQIVADIIDANAERTNEATLAIDAPEQTNPTETPTETELFGMSEQEFKKYVNILKNTTDNNDATDYIKWVADKEVSYWKTPEGKTKMQGWLNINNGWSFEDAVESSTKMSLLFHLLKTDQSAYNDISIKYDSNPELFKAINSLQEELQFNPNARTTDHIKTMVHDMLKDKTFTDLVAELEEAQTKTEIADQVSTDITDSSAVFSSTLATFQSARNAIRSAGKAVVTSMAPKKKGEMQSL